MTGARRARERTIQPPARAAVFCALLAMIRTVMQRGPSSLPCLALVAVAAAGLGGCRWTRALRDFETAIVSGDECTIRLAAGRHSLGWPLEIPQGFRRVVIDGGGAATLVGGLDIERPDWRAPGPGVLERLPAEARAHVRVLEVPAERLADWPNGLVGPLHTGHTVDVPFAPTEVFVGGRALTPARWPNEGWATIERIVDAGSVPRNDEPDMPAEGRRNEPPRGGVFVPTDRARPLRWSSENHVWLTGFWNWDWSDETLPLAGVDAATGAVTLGMPHRYGLAARGKFFVSNALAELDAPGECWIDCANRCIVAWLPVGGEGERVTVSMLAAPLIAIPGRDGAREVVIRGVRFEATRGAAIVGRGVRGAVVEDCVFRNTGIAAVELEGTGCVVRRSRFEDIGGAGVLLAGGDPRSLAPGAGRVEDCVFRRCGRLQRTYRPAIELSGVGHAVMRNEISELPHFAIRFSGCEHRIEANHIHHVVEETGDAGAVYVGRDVTTQGNVLRGNLVHDVRGTDARYQNAFYLDDMASGITIEDNLFVRCNWGVLVGGGRDNVLRDNAFVECGKAIMYDARGTGWMAFAIADPSTSTILQRLAATPVDEEPWRSRYPRLREYRTDRFARPVGGVVEGTTLVGSALGRIEDRECVAESGTVELQAPQGESLRAYGDRLIGAAREGEVEIGRTRVGPVGPRRRGGAP